MLFSDRPTKRDDFYSELCSKRSRGLARVWTLELEGNIICTVGATRWQMVRHTWPAARPWKLCGAKASAGGSSPRWRMPSPPKAGCPVFLCSPERVHFYTRLGFEKMGEYWQGMATP